MSRDITIRMRLNNSDFTNKMRAAQTNLKTFNKEIQKSAAKREAINDLGTSFGKMGLVAAAGAAVAIRAFANFDQAMSSVKATGKDAANNINALRQAAIKAGADTQYSATEAAGAVENLAKAGVSAADILGGGLRGSLDLAAAGQLEVADAAQIAAIAMVQFKLRGEDLPHVADLLAAGAGKANGSVSDLGMALNQSGLIAKQTGLSIEETTGTLAAFASAGLLGSDAGTSFKTMLQSLTPSSKQAKTLIDKYNISAYDAQGNFIGMTKFAGKLHDGLKGLSKEQRNATLKTIFGSDAIRAASVLYDQGAKGIEGWTKKVDDAGYASKTAATKMDNLKGDWEQLTGSLETALIGIGEGANSPLRGLLQDVKGVVDAFGALPKPVQGATLKLLAMGAALGGSVFVASRLVTGFANVNNSLNTLAGSSDKLTKKSLMMRGGLGTAGLGLLAFSDQIGHTNKTAGNLSTVLGGAMAGAAFGPWGAAAGAAAGGLKLLADANHVAVPDIDSLTGSLDRQTGALTANSRAQVLAALNEKGKGGKPSVLAQGREVGIKPGTIVDASLGDKAALAKIRGQRDAIVRAYGEAVRNGTAADFKGPDPQEFDAILKAITGQNDAVDEATQKWKDNKAAMSGSLEMNKLSAAQMAAVGKAAKSIPKEAITKFTQPGYKGAVQNAVDIAKKYKLSPKEVRTALRALNYTKPQIDAVLRGMKNVDGKEAKAVLTAKDAASSVARAVQRAIDGIRGKTVTITTNHVSTGRNGQGGTVKGAALGLRIPAGYASGGKVPGTSPSDPMEDNVYAEGRTGRPLMVRSGEWIINEPQSKKNDRWLRAINDGLDMNKMFPGYAGGGVPGGPSGGSVGGPAEFRITSGALRIEGGEAYVTGIAVAVYGGNENHKASAGRRRTR